MTRPTNIIGLTRLNISSVRLSVNATHEKSSSAAAMNERYFTECQLVGSSRSALLLITEEVFPGLVAS